MNTVGHRAAFAALLVTFAASVPAAAGSPEAGVGHSGKKAPTGAEPEWKVRQRVEVITGEGKKLAKQGQWAEALEKFHEAAALRTTAKLLLLTGLAEENLGHLLEAKALYTRAQHDAQEAKLAGEEEIATQALSDLGPKIPHVVIRVVPPGVGAEASLDGTPLTAGSDAIPVDPGPHTVVVTAAGCEPYRKDILLERGAGLVVDAVLHCPPPPPVKPLSPPPRTDAIVLGAMGSGLLLTGGGLLIAGAASDHNKASLLGGGSALALLGLGAGVGALVMAFGPGAPQGPRQSAPPARPQPVVQAAPLPGGAWLGMHGVF